MHLFTIVEPRKGEIRFFSVIMCMGLTFYFECHGFEERKIRAYTPLVLMVKVIGYVGVDYSHTKTSICVVGIYTVETDKT